MISWKVGSLLLFKTHQTQPVLRHFWRIILTSWINENSIDLDNTDYSLSHTFTLLSHFACTFSFSPLYVPIFVFLSICQAGTSDFCFVCEKRIMIAQNFLFHSLLDLSLLHFFIKNFNVPQFLFLFMLTYFSTFSLIDSS